MRDNFRPKTLAFLADGAIALLLGALTLSFAAASAIAVRRGLALDTVGVAGAVAVLALLAVALGVALRVPARHNDARFLLGCATAAIAARVLIWVASPDYRQAGDCLLMLDAVRILARDGFGDEVMRRLASRYYDDYLWAGRSLPFLLPLARLWPGYEVETSRVLNLVLSIVHNLMVYGLCLRIADRRAARAAYALITCIPIHSWLILDYTHQYLGAFLVLGGVYLLTRASDGASAPIWRRVCDGLLFGLALSALHFQSGIDKFMLVIAACALALHLLAYGLRDERTMRLIVTLAVGALVFIPIAHRFTEWLNQYRFERMSSHPISFTARGWNLVTWGEYYGVYEQIDRETPWPHKPDAMAGLILAQMAYEPARTLIALPAVKVAKYYLIGYATAIEQQLAASERPRRASLFRGMRISFAPLFLLLGITGLWRLLGSTDARRPDLLLAASVPLIFCAIYLVAGETSPRYSFHIHGLLAILGAMAFGPRGAELPVRLRAARVAGWGLAVLLALALAALVAPRAIGRWAAPYLIADMRRTVEDGDRAAPADSTVFTRVLGARAQQIALAPPPGRELASFFVWPMRYAAAHPDARLLAAWSDAIVVETPLRAMRHVQRFAFDTGGKPGVLRMRIDGVNAGTEEPGLRWGYIRFDPRADE